MTESKISNLFDALKHFVIGMAIAAVGVGLICLLVNLFGSPSRYQ